MSIKIISKKLYRANSLVENKQYLSVHNYCKNVDIYVYLSITYNIISFLLEFTSLTNDGLGFNTMRYINIILSNHLISKIYNPIHNSVFSSISLKAI